MSNSAFKIVDIGVFTPSDVTSGSYSAAGGLISYKKSGKLYFSLGWSNGGSSCSLLYSADTVNKIAADLGETVNVSYSIAGGTTTTAQVYVYWDVPTLSWKNALSNINVLSGILVN